MLTSGNSFRLLTRAEKKEIRQSLVLAKENSCTTEVVKKTQVNTESENKKRVFLKLAGAVGLSAVAALIVPRKADALVFGSTPASNVVGLKDDLNNKISPATEGTLATIKADTTKFKFDGENLKVINGGTGGNVGIIDKTSTQINPASEDAVIYLRRIVKLLESSATVDYANRQKVIVEGMPAITGAVTMTGTTITGMSGLRYGMDERYKYIDAARLTYAAGIRANIINQ